jgi:hypothetical protein
VIKELLAARSKRWKSEARITLSLCCMLIQAIRYSLRSLAPRISFQAPMG